MNNNKYIQDIDKTIKITMQEELVAEIERKEQYKEKINNIKLDMYLKLFYLICKIL